MTSPERNCLLRCYYREKLGYGAPTAMLENIGGALAAAGFVRCVRLADNGSWIYEITDEGRRVAEREIEAGR